MSKFIKLALIVVLTL